MNYTIQIETHSINAYAAIHAIMVKSNVVKRLWRFFCYSATIRTRKGPQTYEVIKTALQKAGIRESAYKLTIDPPIPTPKG
ncbi:MAG: hypothetical protein IKM99_11030 [Bacteroidales bacterium]|nr:hypothetical protein [Bacteroidales bacterium]